MAVAAASFARPFGVPDGTSAPCSTRSSWRSARVWSAPMSVDVSSTILINCSRARVSGYAANPDHVPEWYVNIKAADWKTPPPVTIGSRIAFVAHLGDNATGSHADDAAKPRNAHRVFEMARSLHRGRDAPRQSKRPRRAQEAPGIVPKRVMDGRDLALRPVWRASTSARGRCAESGEHFQHETAP